VCEIKGHFKGGSGKGQDPLKILIRQLSGLIMAAIDIDKLSFPFQLNR
jgi:hypothetical protein